MAVETPPALCPRHQVPAIKTCSRCGAFTCERCIEQADDGDWWCSTCLGRSEVRLAASPRARRALWMALAGLHGVLPLLPVAFWFAQSEWRAIDRGAAPPAGRPWAQAARWVSAGAVAAWVVGLLYAFS